MILFVFKNEYYSDSEDFYLTQYFYNIIFDEFRNVIEKESFDKVAT